MTNPYGRQINLKDLMLHALYSWRLILSAAVLSSWNRIQRNIRVLSRWGNRCRVCGAVRWSRNLEKSVLGDVVW